MGRLRWTSEAEGWLSEIHAYIAKDNPAAARRTVRRIYERAQVLATHPDIGHVYQPASAEKVRILLYGHYRIVYRVIDGGEVEILGVFHGALDLDRYLG